VCPITTGGDATLAGRRPRAVLERAPNSESLCNRLARANVIALRGWPVLKTWLLFERDAAGVYHTLTEIFGRFDWRV